MIGQIALLIALAEDKPNWGVFQPLYDWLVNNIWFGALMLIIAGLLFIILLLVLFFYRRYKKR